MYKKYYDICIFGGGVAGIIAAKKLTDWGYSVLLVEKNLKPRYDHYLSLTSGTLHWLEFLQLDDAIFPKLEKYFFNTLHCWNREDVINSIKPNQGFHIHYSTFINLLLSTANESGLSLFKPLTRYNIAQLENGDLEIDLSNDSTTIKIKASFLIEACGMQTVIKSKKKAILPKLIAVCGQFEAKEDRENCIIEAGPDFWLWGTPFTENLYIVNFFSSPEVYKKYKDLGKFMGHAIQQSKLLPLLIKSKAPLTYYTCPATAYADDNIISSSHIKIGDSAYCFDPIASQGIQKAIQSGVHGAAVVNTLLSKKENSNIAITFYRQMISTGIKQHQQHAGMIYDKQDIHVDTDFWRSRFKFKEKSVLAAQVTEIGLNDVLAKSIEYNQVETAAFQNNFIEPVIGLRTRSSEEVFVFLDDINIENLVSLCHNNSLKECLQIFKRKFPKKDPIELLRWLLFNRLVVQAV